MDESLVETSAPARWLPRYSMRSLTFVILLAALLLGWAASEQRAAQERWRAERVAHEQMQLRVYAEEELRRARDELQDQQRGPRPDLARSFWEGDLEGSNLTAMTIASNGNAFQRASFRKCRLEGATLVGGDASFQNARFDAAKLAGASLRGGSASFQQSSFVGADLAGATIAGGGASFQMTTFEGAILINATLSGSFQLVNLSGAKLEGADVSAIARDDLASCYFKVPPTYDAKTKFPPGFDPIEHSWKRVE